MYACRILCEKNLVLGESCVLVSETFSVAVRMPKFDDHKLLNSGNIQLGTNTIAMESSALWSGRMVAISIAVKRLSDT